MEEHLTFMLMAILPGVVIGYFLSSFIHFLLKNKTNDKDFNVVSFHYLIKAEHLAFMKDEEKVASLQVIGRGSRGDVYKVDIPEIESRIKTIVLKNIREDIPENNDRNLKQMRAEIRTVGHIRHQNVLPLLAHVSRKSYHYLVFPFMKNGSLQSIMREVRDGTRQLNRLQRHKIAIGVAAGLDYIHQNLNPCILHRDLKPDNILLDEELRPRITGFGLSETITNTHTHMSFSNAGGTRGYMAPEYFETHNFPYKRDMFSYGVILAVLVTGKFPTDDDLGVMTLPDWIKDAACSEDPRTAIDKKLIGNGYEAQMIDAIKIACLCTSYNPKHRPDTRCVRQLLENL